MIYVKLPSIKERLLRVIDSAIDSFDSTLKYALDESKLEELIDLIHSSLMTEPKQATRPKQRSPQMAQISALAPIAPAPQLMQIDSNHIKSHSRNGATDKLSFDKNDLCKYSAIAQISENCYLISGGCLASNPRIKSNRIQLLNTHDGSLTLEATLPYPVSSHACVSVAPWAYFLGGKKDEGVITRECCAYNIQLRQLSGISSLEYAAASFSAVAWRDEFIYKIGGVGQCFGDWNVSPYIERYCIQADCWQTINPDIRQYPGIQTEFQLYAYSLAYLAADDRLVILGGFDEKGKGTNFGCILQVGEQKHEIVEHGSVRGLQAGGFWCSQALGGKGQILCLQTCLDPKIAHKVVKIPTKDPKPR